MPINCPICGESFKDARGLHGHLRFKESLEGRELERVFSEAKEQEAVEAEGSRSSDGSSRAQFGDPVLQAAEQVRLWKGRMKAVEESKHGYSKPLVSERQRVKREVWDRCKEKVEEAKQALDEAISREAERREDDSGGSLFS